MSGRREKRKKRSGKKYLGKWGAQVEGGGTIFESAGAELNCTCAKLLCTDRNSNIFPSLSIFDGGGDETRII